MWWNLICWDESCCWKQTDEWGWKIKVRNEEYISNSVSESKRHHVGWRRWSQCTRWIMVRVFWGAPHSVRMDWICMLVPHTAELNTSGTHRKQMCGLSQVRQQSHRFMSVESEAALTLELKKRTTPVEVGLQETWEMQRMHPEHSGCRLPQWNLWGANNGTYQPSIIH